MPKCPLCGAKCETGKYGGWIWCSKFYLDNDPCHYYVSEDSHRAICRALSAKGKGRVVAEGYICDGDIHSDDCFIRIDLCKHGPDVAAVPCTSRHSCRRVVVMEAKP